MAEPTQAQRDRWAKAKIALPDGSFYIRNRSDLHNALVRLHQASNRQAAVRHIVRRARILGAVAMLPKEWGVRG